MDAPDQSGARAQAVAATLDRVRAIEAAQGVTRPALEAMKAELMALAARAELFPEAEFAPPPEGTPGARRYLLQADADDRFAAYLLAQQPGNSTQPHDHTTWAVIAAIEGQELNRVYRRAGDAAQGSDPEHQPITLDREVTVEPGTGLALMPEDIHSIHTGGTRPTRHLHVYGLALERLDSRMAYDAQTGRAQPYNRAFMKPTETR